MMDPKITNFEKAFADGAGSFLACCACGKTYCFREYYGEEKGDAEIIAKAIKLEWSPSWLTFEGSTYVMDCDCWHKRAEQIMRFLDAHGHKIVAYYRLEKARKVAEAAALPDAGDGAPGTQPEGGAA
jgi:hypothetical protein